MKSYDGYKDSGIEWIGEIPKHWELKKGKYVLRYKKNTAGQRAKNYQRLSLTYDGVIPRSKKDLQGLQPGQFNNYQIINNNDLVFKLIDLENINTSRVGYSNYSGIVSPAYIKIGREKDNKYYYYLYYTFYIEEVFNDLGSSGVRSSINSSDLLNMEILEPDYSTQQKIASFLDQKTTAIDNIIEKKEKLIEKLEAYKKSVITEAVTKGKLGDKYINEDGELVDEIEMKDSGVEWLGKVPDKWDVLKIKRLTQIQRGASPRPIDDSKYFDENGRYSWVRISDVTKSNDYLYQTEQTLSKLGASKSVKLDENELFLSICATIGKPIISKIKCCIHDGFVYFPQYNGSNKYLFYIFKSGQPYKGLGKHGTQINLNTDIVGDIYIPYPNLNQQQKISSFLNSKISSLNKLIEYFKQSIQKYKAYKKSLIYEAVTGKLDLRDYDERGNNANPNNS